MSDLTSATQHDLSAAIEALNLYLAEVEEFGEAPIPVGHLRTLAAALEAPHVPGMVEVDRTEYWRATGRGAMLTVWADVLDRNGTISYFLAVQS